MMSLILQVIVLLAGGMIIIRIEPALNQMNFCTPLLIRAAFQLLALGAAAEVVCVIYGDVPDWPAASITVGVAILLIGKRWQQLLRPLSMKNLP